MNLRKRSKAFGAELQRGCASRAPSSVFLFFLLLPDLPDCGKLRVPSSAQGRCLAARLTTFLPSRCCPLRSSWRCRDMEVAPRHVFVDLRISTRFHLPCESFRDLKRFTFRKCSLDVIQCKFAQMRFTELYAALSMNPCELTALTELSAGSG